MVLALLVGLPSHPAGAEGVPYGAPPADASAAAQAIPAQLHLQDALALFHERGFDLLLADAAVRSAEGDLTAARAFPNPVASGTGGTAFHYDPNQCTRDCSRMLWSGSLSDQGLLFDLVIGKRRLKVDVARLALQAARYARADAERTLTALVKQQYVSTVLARAVLGFAREAAASSARTGDLVRLRFRAGDVAEADVARAETSRLEAEQAVDAAQQALAAAKASLGFLLGIRDPTVEFDVDADLPATIAPPALEGATPASLLTTARAKRADLAAARAQVASAEAALALARRQRLPDIAVTAGYTQQGTGQEALQPPTAALQLSLPLPLFDRNTGAIQKAEANLRAQSVQRDKIDAQIATDVVTAFSAYQSAATRLHRMESGLLDNARRARDLVEYQYQKGAASLLELLDAQRSFTAVNAEYFQNLGDYWAARYQIEQATSMETAP